MNIATLFHILHLAFDVVGLLCFAVVLVLVWVLWLAAVAERAAEKRGPA